MKVNVKVKAEVKAGVKGLEQCTKCSVTFASKMHFTPESKTCVS